MAQPERGEPRSGSLLIAVEQLAVEQLEAAHDRYEPERSDITSSQNSAGDGRWREPRPEPPLELLTE